jgi:hypothetical protein
MTKLGSKVQTILEDAKVSEPKNKSDTLKIWEAYREQALLWRAIALLQIPATLAAIIFSIVVWLKSSPIIHIPLKPAPGIYTTREIPDVEFVELATEFINLIASYQSIIARRQFEQARTFLVEPMLTEFTNEMLGEELKAIESTSRTQLFFVDATKNVIERNPDSVTVKFTGERLKIVAGKELPTVTSRYSITIKTIPRNKLNPYGLAITKVSFENL